MWNPDKFREECGVFGVYGHPEAANLVYLGLYALQHRGQESAGICSSDEKQLHLEKSVGLVADIFTEKRLKKLPGYVAIGHNRYSTAGGSNPKNVQPILANFSMGQLAISHNGNLINAYELRKSLEKNGAIFQSSTDSEVIVHLLARQPGPVEDALIASLRQVEGAYSLLLLTPTKLIAARDPYGFRPLILARLGGAHVFASETSALNLV
ncbi:MAG: amidophosphoribosyltransferase, partial [Nitrospiraceae bacterium]|nr:amidophosphoribosyltransferase [Nitrospiraceae bacterium]